MAKKAVASRMDDLFNDMMLVDSGDLIAGVDEAGRGPLAGAVYAAAVILNPDEPCLWTATASRKFRTRQTPS